MQATQNGPYLRQCSTIGFRQPRDLKAIGAPQLVAQGRNVQLLGFGVVYNFGHRSFSRSNLIGKERHASY